MSIEVMEQALAALETCRIRSVSEWEVSDVTPKNVTAAISALRTALSQQPDNTSCKSVQKRLEAQQPATGEPVQADSSEHLRVIASLGAALRRLSFAAQTTGGTDGPDAELQSAIGQAEQALSLGGIWQAMSATAEPDEWKLVPIVPTEKMLLAYTGGAVTNAGFRWCRHQWSAMLAAAPAAHPAPSVPKDHQIAALVNKVRDIARMFHDHQSLRERIAIELVPALKASQEVKSNAERWRYAIADSGNQTMNFIDIFDDWDGDGSFVEAFDKARLADKA